MAGEMIADFNRNDDGFGGSGGFVTERQGELVSVYVSAYTNFDALAHHPKGTEGAGVRRFALDVGRKELVDQGIVSSAANPNPAFMRADGRNLYLVNERIDTNGSVFAYRIQPSGALQLVNQLDAAGKSTCYVHKDRLSQYAILINYWDATISVASLDQDGALKKIVHVHKRPGYEYCQKHSPDRNEHLTHRQGWSHTHCVVPSPDDRFFFVPDLGEDKVHQFRLDRSNGSLELVAGLQLQEGHGPRHMVFHPSGNVAFVVNELDSTVDVLRYNYGGEDELALSVVQTLSTLPPGLKGKSHCAEIKVGPNGRFLYVANRFSDSLAVFSINLENLEKEPCLSLVAIQSSLGNTPRHFSFCGNLMLVANTDNDSLVLFEVDEATGLLKYTGKTYPVASPNYVLVVPPASA